MRLKFKLFSWYKHARLGAEITSSSMQGKQSKHCVTQQSEHYDQLMRAKVNVFGAHSSGTCIVNHDHSPQCTKSHQFSLSLSTHIL
jgi:hypothetical protein